MNSSQIYILVSIIVLAVIAILGFFVHKNNTRRKKPFSKLTSLAFAFVLAGILFGNEKILGYILFGIGIVLAIVDIIRKTRKK